MGKKSNRNAWMFDTKVQKRPDCHEALDEFEKFGNADQVPIEASDRFKKNLREKLWHILKNKHYIFFAFMMIFFS